ncbi:MAG: sigma-70 family RNA polymerase sigma factor, partial [Clostridiaceae bacterium]|nr:sigma-70 family RNA polymerase sigma factor [Clostridiaceae bacterium]
ALSMLGNKHDIEDAMQETIVKAYKGILNLKKEEYFKTWLIRILINECNDTLKDIRKVVSIEKVNYESSHTETLINLELTNAINLLDEDLKVVTTLFYFEDLLQKDIAKILNIPEGTVHSRLSRARSKLYEMLKERCD